MKTKLNLIGKIFNKWTVIKRGSNYRGNARWNVRCKCGVEGLVIGRLLLNGKSKGCNKCHKITHGMTDTRTHNIWMNMRERCNNPSNSNFYLYGKRGIKVCERWNKSFVNFLEDMGESPRNLTLDRIDNNGPYCKSNCRWADSKPQSRNKRSFMMEGATRGLWKLICRLSKKDRCIVRCINCANTIEKSFTQFRKGELGKCISCIN